MFPWGRKCPPPPIKCVPIAVKIIKYSIALECKRALRRKRPRKCRYARLEVSIGVPATMYQSYQSWHCGPYVFFFFTAGAVRGTHICANQLCIAAPTVCQCAHATVTIESNRRGGIRADNQLSTRPRWPARDPHTVVLSASRRVKGFGTEFFLGALEINKERKKTIQMIHNRWNYSLLNIILYNERIMTVRDPNITTSSTPAGQVENM